MSLPPKDKKLATSMFSGRINRELWQSFRKVCEESDLGTTEVLIAYIKDCVDENKVIKPEKNINEYGLSIKELSAKIDIMNEKLDKVIDREQDNELLF